MALDLMHTCDLGLLLHFFGSVLHNIVYDATLGTNQNVRCQVLWLRIQNLYKELQTPTRLTRLECKF